MLIHNSINAQIQNTSMAARVVEMADEARRYRSIEINVGGTILHTTEHTLAKADDNSLLHGLIDTLTTPEENEAQQQKKIFFDRDPSLFESLLYVLRTGQKPPPIRSCCSSTSSSTTHETLTRWFRCLETEANFYGVTEALKSAFIPGEFNGMGFTCKYMPLSTGHTPYTSCTISAVPDGDFVVSRGNRLSWYDWSLNNIRSVATPARNGIDLLAHVNKNVVVASARLGSMLYVYDAGHKFHRGCIQYRDYQCQSVVSGDDGRIILSMMNNNVDNNKAVLEVDAETLQTSRVLAAHERSSAHTKGKGKLQWIESHRLLLAAYTGGYNSATHRYESCIKLFDVRAPNVEIMSCIEGLSNRTYGDLVWSEGHGKIIKVCKECDMGDSLMYAGDLRNRLGIWERCSATEPTRALGDCNFDTRLIAHGKQLFSSSKQSLMVWDEVEESGLCFCSSIFDWGETNIRGMAFGGERLYVVRDGANMVEILETDHQNLL